MRPTLRECPGRGRTTALWGTLPFVLLMLLTVPANGRPPFAAHYSPFASSTGTKPDRAATDDAQQVGSHRLDMLRQKPASLVDLLRPA